MASEWGFSAANTATFARIAATSRARATATIDYRREQAAAKLAHERSLELAGGTRAAPVAAAPSVSKEALAALTEAKKQYQPGGGYGAGLEAALGRGAKKSIAAGTQSLVSSGLASTTMGAGLGKQYEEEVATPARADLESRRAVALSGLETLEAQMQQGGSQSAMDRSLALQQQQIGITASSGQQIASLGAQSSQAAAQRSFSGNQAALNRQFQGEQAQAGRDFQMEQMEYASSQAPAAGQHITSSTGVSSFLANLRSQDIMSAPDWNFGT